MHYRWLMPFVAMAVMSQTSEVRLARQLDHEAQFQLRFARRDVAMRNLQIAEWLAPNSNRQTLLRSQPNKKGNTHDIH